jgi:TIR domain/BON domain
MLRVLISYRREDSAGQAGRLYDMLAEHFGRERVFMDVATIGPGDDFAAVIRTAVMSADVVIALIGRNWLGVTTPGVGRRLDDPNDFVKLEITSALERGIRVVPVLVQDAVMPGPNELPAALTSLAGRNAVEVRDRHFRRDVLALIEALEGRKGPRRKRAAWAAGSLVGLVVLGLGGWLVARGHLPSGTPSTVPVAETSLPPAGPTPMEPARVRSLVEQRLREQGFLRGSAAGDTGVTVDVTPDRVVILTGVLRDATQRDQAVGLAQGTPGVSDVRANLNLSESWR